MYQSTIKSAINNSFQNNEFLLRHHISISEE